MTQTMSPPMNPPMALKMTLAMAPVQPRRSAARAALSACALAAAAAASPPALAADALPVSATLGFETLRLPGQEQLGLARTELLFDIGNSLWLGPVVYGAATGQRGGLFVGGVALERRWALPADLRLDTSLGLGGGGGAAAPVGNGLLLRPALQLSHAVGPLRVGISASRVQFAGSSVHSNQLGLLLQWQHSYRHVPLAQVDERQPAAQRSGLGFDRIALTAGRYRLGPAGATRPFALVGVRLEQDIGGGTPGANTWGLEASAAAQGTAAGYMDLLAHAGHSLALGPVRLGLRAAVGLGGGGAVLTGGGAMARLDATLQASLPAGWQLGAGLGRVRGQSSLLRGQRAELWLAHSLEPAGAPGTAGRAGTVRAADWGGGLLHINPVQRGNGGRQAVEAIGLVLNQGLGPALGGQTYLSGQAYSALAGAAGGYSIGLVGAGWASGGDADLWRGGAELLAGGAGGGGVQQTSGALLLGQAWLSRRMAEPAQRLRLSVGALAPLQDGKSTAPVLSLVWTRSFGLVGP